MKKPIKITIIIIAIIIVAAVIVFLTSSVEKPANQNGTPSVPANIEEGAENTVIDGVEFMGSQEKAELRIPDNQKIQVLERSEDGAVAAYKIINSDEDIIAGSLKE